MRFAKFIIILGVAFLLASFVPSPSATHGKLLERGYYDCILVNGFGNLFVDISGADNRNISLYILDYEDTLKLIDEESLENTTALFSIENVLDFAGTINLPRPGWYGIVIIANIANPVISNMRYDISIAVQTPYLVPLALFIVSEVLGVGLILYDRSLKKDENI